MSDEASPAQGATTLRALIDACRSGPSETVRAHARQLGSELAGHVVASLLDGELARPTDDAAPIVAAHLAHELRLTRAVPALVHCLVTMPIAHPLALVSRAALTRLGADAVDALVAAFRTAPDPESRERVAMTLLRTNVVDDRIRAAFVRVLDDDPEKGAAYLAEYGDTRSIPDLVRALDPSALAASADCAICASQRAIAIVCAIRALGGTVTAAQSAGIDRLLEREKGLWRPFPSHPRPPRNGPCPCGSGRKYKKCCYLSDGDVGAGH
jgi:hypothetical protein